MFGHLNIVHCERVVVHLKPYASCRSDCMPVCRGRGYSLICFISVVWPVLFFNCLAEKEESWLLYFQCILSIFKCILSVFL